jgi:hypothetical protein
MYKSAFFALFVAASVGCGQQEPPAMYRFAVANDRLFAIEQGTSYGTERAVYATDDLGDRWTVVDAPRKTCALAGNGTGLFARTSLGGIWRKGLNSNSWTRVKPETGRSEYLYSIAVDSRNRIATAGKDLVTLYNTDGAVLHGFNSDSPTDLFVNALFSGEDDEFLIVEANPFKIFVVDLRAGQMQRWDEGFESAPPVGLSGACRIRLHGDRFLASRHDGIYFAAGLLEPWQKLSSEIRHDDYLGGNFCRDLVSHDAETDAWLVAKNSGIHLMKATTQGETVFADVEDDHDLILAITPFRQYYFVSFARLSNDCVGVRISEDLSRWQSLYLSEKSSE